MSVFRHVCSVTFRPEFAGGSSRSARDNIDNAALVFFRRKESEECLEERTCGLCSAYRSLVWLSRFHEKTPGIPGFCRFTKGPGQAKSSGGGIRTPDTRIMIPLL